VTPELLALRRINAERLRRETLVGHVYRIAGVRGLLEVIEELVKEGLLSHAALVRCLTRFAALDPRIVKAIGADRMPARPLHIVGGGEQ
jgi:hypothetical protein